MSLCKCVVLHRDLTSITAKFALLPTQEIMGLHDRERPGGQVMGAQRQKQEPCHLKWEGLAASCVHLPARSGGTRSMFA